MNKYSSFLFTTCRWERLTLILPLIVSLKTTRSFKTVEQGWNLWHCQPVKEWLEWTKLMREKQVNSVSYVVIFDDDDDDLLLVLLCAFWENSYKNGFLMLVCVCVCGFFSDEHRPIVHPFTCPKNRFHVTSLDFRMLPSLATIILDLMFYSK